MTKPLLTNERRAFRRRLTTALVRSCVGAAVVAWSAYGWDASAQNDGSATNGPVPTALEGNALFVPTLDLESPVVFSSVDASRRNRPPQPEKRPERLRYPEGFLELSAPTPEPTPELPFEETADASTNVPEPIPQEPPKKEEPPRRLDPFAETTPLAPPADPEPPKKEAGDQILFFALSFALAALGGFIYVDYRYRDRLKTELARNARLRSPNAVAADFDDLLASVDRERLDATLEELAFLSTSSLTRPIEEEEPFEPISDCAPPTNGADLNEENFDFAPSSATNPRPTLPEPQEDFVVGANLSR